MNLAPRTSNLEHRALSIYPYATKTELTKFLAYAAIFFIVVNNIHTKRQINRLLRVIYWLVALRPSMASWNTSAAISISSYIKRDGIDSATGTYINRNHFAGYLEMVIPLTLGFLFPIF